jgi:hypothetical protein
VGGEGPTTPPPPCSHLAAIPMFPPRRHHAWADSVAWGRSRYATAPMVSPRRITRDGLATWRLSPLTLATPLTHATGWGWSHHATSARACMYWQFSCLSRGKGYPETERERGGGGGGEGVTPRQAAR